MAQVYWCEKVLGFYRLRLVIVIFPYLLLLLYLRISEGSLSIHSVLYKDTA